MENAYRHRLTRLPEFIFTVFLTGAVFNALPAMSQDSDNSEYRHAKTSSTSQDYTQSDIYAKAADDRSDSQDMRDDEALAEPQSTDNGKVRYVSGGIALSGMRAIDAGENSYNLKMLFVSKGEYLASVKIKISDSRGNSILETTSKGPVLLVKMPSGHYTVSTETEGGDKLNRHISVSNDHLASYVMRYPETQNN